MTKINKEILKTKAHTGVQWAVTFTVNITLFTYGLQSGWLSPMAKILQSPESPAGRPLTDTEISLIAGAPSISASIGILLFVYVVDTFGRRYANILIAVFQLMAWIFSIYPANYASLLVARFFCGLGGGGCFHIVPMYVKEISQESIRGTLGTIMTVFQNVGTLLMYALGGYLDYYTALYIVAGIPAVNILLLSKAPESPSFLVKVGKIEDAAKTIAYLRGLEVNDKEVQTEIDSIKREDEYFKSIPNISFLNIFKIKPWRHGFLILVVICAVRAVNGTLVIINYASTLLATSELDISPVVQSLGIPVFLTFGALITMGTINKLGRKLLLVIHFIVSTLSFSGFASTILLHDHDWATPTWLPILALLLAVFSFGGGVSPIPFIVMAEIFNFQIRAKLMACLSILSWILSIFQLSFFTAISNSAGIYTAFYIFGAINAIGAITTIIYLPETGGKNIEQIEDDLGKEKKDNENRIGY